MPLRQTIGISLALLMASAGAMAKSPDKSIPLIRRASLSFLLMLIIASAHAQCPPTGGITIDNVNNGNFGYYNGDVGPYWSDLNVWDPPTDSSSYSTTITNCPSTYPNGTVISWSFPDYLNGTSNVYAYPDIVYGILGGGYPPTPANIPTPIQLGSLPSAFSLTYNITLNANPDNQDVLIETWPTTVPNPPNLSTNDTRTNEIGFMAHVPSYTLEYLLSFPNHIDYSADGSLVTTRNAQKTRSSGRRKTVFYYEDSRRRFLGPSGRLPWCWTLHGSARGT